VLVVIVVEPVASPPPLPVVVSLGAARAPVPVGSPGDATPPPLHEIEHKRTNDRPAPSPAILSVTKAMS
jgi:hypothetical protein